MKKLILFAAIAIFFAACSSETKKSNDATRVETAMGNFDSYGGMITPDSTIDAKTLLTEMGNAPTYDTKLKAKVVEVCQKKGCWMNVELGNGEVMKVTFKDYAFFVPTDNAMMAGKEVIMQGTAKFATISVEDQKHYAEDGGASKAEMDAIKEPKNEITFEANGVLVPVAAEATK
jgi:hypothetical protein